MAPSRTSQREKPCVPQNPTLLIDLVLEIVARSNYRTLVRCAATCRLLRRKILKLLRREILCLPLDRRLTQVAPRILAYLCNDAKKPLALIHPSTGPTLSFCHKQLPRFLSRKTVTLLDKYKPVSSRRGLVLLHRIKMKNRPEAERCFDMCVYDPMSGVQKFFPDPTESKSNQYSDPKYIVLTAADGISSSFLLLLFDVHYPNRCYVSVKSVSLCGTREYVWYGSDRDFPWGSLKKHGNPAILDGGVLHWLPCRGEKIISFDLGTRKPGSLNLPPTNCDVNHGGNQLYLATSSDRKLLKLLAIQGFTMFVWRQLPVSTEAAGGWSLETVIDMEENLRSLDPRITDGPNKRIEFEGNGKTTGEVVFLVEVQTQGYTDFHSEAIIVFDLETKKMHRQKHGLSLLEIDLESRLQTL